MTTFLQLGVYEYNYIIKYIIKKNSKIKKNLCYSKIIEVGVFIGYQK